MKKINMMKNIVVAIIIIVLAGCSSVPDKTVYEPAEIENNQVLVKQYYIGVDDQVEVNVWQHPDLSISVPVRPDGVISVPLIGEVLAGGKTPKDVANDITNKLAKYIRDPRVSVILVELRSHEFLSRIRVTGAVRNPQSLPFRQGMTVLDVILVAGGLNDFADPNDVLLFRKNGTKVTKINIYLDDILSQGDMTTNVSLQPGDILTVPERMF